ncbi:hypothetical protein ACVWW1_004593 [Bradyrhizobium sp. JR3.5]
MTVRNLSPATQRSYLNAVSKFSRYFGRSPDHLGLEDVHAFQVHLVATGISWPALNQIVCALRCFYSVTLGHSTIPERIAYAREPRKLRVVLSADEVVSFCPATSQNPQDSVGSRVVIPSVGSEGTMKPKERRDSGQADLLRSRLDAIIDMNHALVKLSRTIDWSFLEERFGAVHEDKPGRPPLPTRLMAGLAILKHTYDLSDAVLCERWVENPYYRVPRSWCVSAGATALGEVAANVIQRLKMRSGRLGSYCGSQNGPRIFRLATPQVCAVATSVPF